MMMRLLFASFALVQLVGLSAQTWNPSSGGLWINLTQSQQVTVTLWGIDELQFNNHDVCWKQSYGNGVGTSMVCPPGTTKEGLMCYTTCPEGYVASSGDLFCYKVCPPEFRNDGLYCAKPDSYGRGAGVVRINGCHDDEERWGGLCHNKCRDGFFNAGCCICSPQCPGGWEDIGVSCKKPVFYRQMTAPSVCPAGTVKDPSGALCYPPCQENYYMVGPVCWRHCRPAHPFECGALCAMSVDRCALATIDMVMAPAMMVVSLASLGTLSPLSNLARTITKSGKLTTTTVNRIKQFYTIGESLQTAAYLADAEIGILTSTIQGGIANALQDRLVRAYGMVNAVETMSRISEAMVILLAIQALAEIGITIIAAVDPTGILGVITAYAHPKCRDATLPPNIPNLYFPPGVAPIYNRASKSCLRGFSCVCDQGWTKSLLMCYQNCRTGWIPISTTKCQATPGATLASLQIDSNITFDVPETIDVNAVASMKHIGIFIITGMVIAVGAFLA